MKLLDLVMSYGGINIWPPIWKPAKQGSLNTVRGEVGVLIYAHSNPNASGKCYIVMEYQGETYVGTLTFESHAFCRKSQRFSQPASEKAHQGDRRSRALIRNENASLKFQIAYFVNCLADMGFQKYRNAFAKSGVVKNQPADEGKIFVRNVDIKSARRFRI